MSGIVISFVIYSFLGWIFECVYCTSIEKHWQNRGFLFGPICPIYGVGSLLIILIYKIFDFTPLELFIIACLGSVFLELFTSVVLEKLFHAVWWDYSNLPFNYHGRVSLFTSMGFGIGGLIVIYGLLPYIEKIIFFLNKIVVGDGSRIDSLDTKLYEYGFGHGFFLIDCLAMLCIVLLTVDITLTVSALSSFREMMEKRISSFDSKMESLTGGILNLPEKTKEILHEKRFDFFFKNSIERIKVIKIRKKNKSYP